jgi:deoxyribose-phosphate aldolase
MTRAEFAKTIDQTLLRPDASRRETIAFCEAAAPHGFATVCLLPAWVADAVDSLDGTGTAIGTVVGFPHGNAPAQAKAIEAATAVADGATEIDMVLNISALKSGADLIVLDEIGSVVDAVAPAGAIVKVILECALLTDREKAHAARLAVDSGAQFVKTSTGFAVPAAGIAVGATVADVALLRATVGPQIGVKASGGIRTLADARALWAAGASRLGTSAGIALLAAFASEVPPR